MSPQIPTRMKIAALCLTCFLSAANANSLYSQSARLSIEMNNVSIEDVLNKIEENSEFHFIYNNELVNVDRKVNVKFDNETIESILKKVFKSTNVEYKVNEKQIILRPKEMDIVAKVQQEQKTVKGVVSDQFGPIAGANVSIQGTTVGTITDMDGNFTIEVPENATLQISFIGYNTCFVKVAGQSNLNVTLTEDTQKLDEVVVIGYGTQNRQAITGSIAKAKLETYSIVPTNNVLETIKGSMPGLNVGGTNTAGGTPSFSIRGQNSTRNSAEDNGNQPLVVLDGAIYNGSLADIPSDDIESFTVLKDASAAAVYGSRSANGVILIQTKRGRSEGGKPSFNVNLSYGISNELKRLEVYDAPGYLQRMLDIRSLNGMEADASKIPYYLEEEEKRNYEATSDHRPTLKDPYDMFRQNAYDLKANVSISNSSELASYYISANMTDQKGVLMNDDYKNFSGRVNIDTHLTDWLKIGVKSNYSIRDYSGSAPSMEQATTQPEAFSGRPSRRYSDGFDTSSSPVPCISKTPISLVAPKRFFAARKIR